MHQFRDKSLAQRELVSAGLLLYPVLQAADVLAYRAARGAGRRGPARAPRADARRRAALQRPLRRRRGSARRARAPHPRGRRADHGPAGADAQDVHDRRLASRAPCTCSTSPTRSRRSSRAPSPTRAARCAAIREKPGVTNLIEILAAVRGVEPARDRGRVRAGAATASSRAPSAAAVVDYLAPVRERYAAAARRRGARSRRSSPTAPQRAHAIAADTLADVRERMGVGAPRGRSVAGGTTSSSAATVGG